LGSSDWYDFLGSLLMRLPGKEGKVYKLILMLLDSFNKDTNGNFGNMQALVNQVIE
jgi:hypothetical protein